MAAEYGRESSYDHAHRQQLSRQSEEVSGSRRRSRFRGYTTTQKTSFGRPYQSPYAE